MPINHGHQMRCALNYNNYFYTCNTSVIDFSTWECVKCLMSTLQQSSHVALQEPNQSLT